MPQIDFNIFSNLNFWTVCFIVLFLDNLVLRFFESYGFTRMVGLKQLAGIPLNNMGSSLVFINKNVVGFIKGVFFSPKAGLFLNFFFFKKSFLFLNFLNSRLINFLNFEAKAYFTRVGLAASVPWAYSGEVESAYQTPEEGIHTVAPGQASFCDPITPNAYAIQNFHHDVMPFLIAIVILVLYLLAQVTNTYSKGIFPRSFSRHNTALEVFWTCLPGLILLLISIPSFALLYSMEEPVPFELTVKCIGHQWYWDYEVSGLDYATLIGVARSYGIGDGLSFGPQVIGQWNVHWTPDLSYEDLKRYVHILKYTCGENGTIDKLLGHYYSQWHGVIEQFIPALFTGMLPEVLGGYKLSCPIHTMDEDTRMLLTKEALVLPVNTHIRLLVTSVDVLHSWTVPALGVKVDACPGRLNQASMSTAHVGVYFGQCSEICGANHAFMPITLHMVPRAVYYDYVFMRFVNHGFMKNWFETFIGTAKRPATLIWLYIERAGLRRAIVPLFFGGVVPDSESLIIEDFHSTGATLSPFGWPLIQDEYKKMIENNHSKAEEMKERLKIIEHLDAIRPAERAAFFGKSREGDES